MTHTYTNTEHAPAVGNFRRSNLGNFKRSLTTFIHRNLSHTDPFKGWRNQMPDEALVTAEVTQRYRKASESLGWGFDGTRVLGGVIGNLMDYARGGGQVRFGYGLSAPWGDQRISQSRIDAESAGMSESEIAAASPNFEVALLAEGEARAVFYNATIDRAPRGLQSSWAHHSPTVLEGGIGASVRVDLGAILCSRFPDLETSYRYIVRSRELEGATLVDSLTGTHRYGVLRVAAAKHF